MYTQAIHIYSLNSERVVVEVKVKYVLIRVNTRNKQSYEELCRKH
jgi:hypothetical protein